MIIQLSEAELEVAVNQYLVSEGMDLSNKITTFEFEGTCSMDIEVDQDAVSTTKPKAKVTRTKRKPKVVEEVAPKAEEKGTIEHQVEEEVPVEKVVETLSMEVGIEPEVMDNEVVNEIPATPVSNSIFG